MTLKISKRDFLFFSWKKCKLDVAENGNTNLLHTNFTQSYLILKSLKVLPFRKLSVIIIQPEPTIYALRFS